MDEHELAWAAGFFDGDGWAALVRQRGRRTGRPQARINQSGGDGVPEVLVRFKEAVGVGRIGGPSITEGRQPLYWWSASSRSDVARIGTLIGPWLSNQKRAQFQAAQPEMTLPASRCDWPIPWAAGFFDAEGSTSLADHGSHAGYKVIEAAVTQLGGPDGPSEQLARFSRCVGVGRVYGPYVQAGAAQPVYRWRAYRTVDARLALHLLRPFIGPVKRRQAALAFQVIDGQRDLPRGRVEWGAHKTHCVHGHEYASARIRQYAGRGVGISRRANKQCLVCARDQARLRRARQKS